MSHWTIFHAPVPFPGPPAPPHQRATLRDTVDTVILFGEHSTSYCVPSGYAGAWPGVGVSTDAGPRPLLPPSPNCVHRRQIRQICVSFGDFLSAFQRMTGLGPATPHTPIIAIIGAKTAAILISRN